MKAVAASVASRSTIALGLPATALAQGDSTRGPQRVAAIQFAPKLGDVNANLSRTDVLVRDALAKGAKWIVLPEFFPSGTALHPSLFNAYQPVDGRPTELVRELAKLGKAFIAGSFMCKSGSDAYNTLVIACPDGTTFTHDKDFPTMVFESSFYAAGEDDVYADRLAKDGAKTVSARIPGRVGNAADGAFAHSGVGIGGALCWEIVRNRTAKRLASKVDILLASSAWWTVDPEGRWPGLSLDQARTTRAEHQALIDAAPPRMARLLGVPVIHANFTGPTTGYSSLTFDQEANGRYLGSSQIVDATGKTLARLGTEEGVLLADVVVGRQQSSEEIPDGFWIAEVSESMRGRWPTSGAAGRDYYLRETRVKRLT
jgi:predicted amidohydrolase